MLNWPCLPFDCPPKKTVNGAVLLATFNTVFTQTEIIHYNSEIMLKTHILNAKWASPPPQLSSSSSFKPLPVLPSPMCACAVMDAPTHLTEKRQGKEGETVFMGIDAAWSGSHWSGETYIIIKWKEVGEGRDGVDWVWANKDRQEPSREIGLMCTFMCK